MKLRGQQIKVGRGQVAIGGSGRVLGLGSCRFLGAPEDSALGRQQVIKAQAGLKGSFDMYQGIMWGYQAVRSSAKCSCILQG